VVVTVETFLGVLLGLLAGLVLCALYFRHEITANIKPRLEHIELQLQNLRSEINLDAATRLTTLHERLEQRRPHD
jgi:hypothetical protein